MNGNMRWGILGTGKIARIMARALARSSTGKLVAVASRSPERAKSFASRLPAVRCYTQYEELMEDPDVDIVYVATHHPEHRNCAITAAVAGKHILCEKPIAVRHDDALAIVDAARRNDVFLMEAFAYRCHPQTMALIELVRSRKIGEVRMIDAVFGYDAGPNPPNYLLVHELAGGSILDVGCYPTSAVHLVARAASGDHVVDAIDVTAVARIGSDGVDHYSAAALSFEGGIIASVGSAVQVDLGSWLRIYGSEGRITVPSPWLPGRDGQASTIVVERRGADTEQVLVSPPAGLYTIEVDAVASLVASGTRNPNEMSWEESLANMRTLDRWRQEIGLSYMGEPDQTFSHSVEAR